MSYNYGPNHLILGCFGLFMIIFISIACSSAWVTAATQVTSQNVPKTTNYVAFRGLWTECIYKSHPNVNGVQELCVSIDPQEEENIKNFGVNATLPSYLSYCRWAIPFSLGLTFIASIAAIIGNPAIQLCNFENKYRIMTYLTAGAFFLSGLLSLIAFSWYTNAANKNYVTNDFIQSKDENGNTFKFFDWHLTWNMWSGFFNSILAILISGYAMVVAYKIGEEVDHVKGDAEY